MEFSINDTVTIKEINCKGFIDRIEFSTKATYYRIVYWLDGKRYETWMYKREIEKVES